MWADNEADLDLLGFDFLVDGLIVALTEPRLLPLTVGVLGDWGSGKSSLMRIAEAELNVIPPRSEAPTSGKQSANSAASPMSRPYLTVQFSPWQYEDHEDVKAALMSAVLDSIAARVPDAGDEVGALRALIVRMRRFGRSVGRMGASVAPTVVPLLIQGAAPDVDPDMLKMVGTVTDIAAKQAGAALSRPATPAEPQTPEIEAPEGNVDAFRRQFKDLVDRIPNCEAVIVFIDDLDRCLPETVVDTFEAIRLFLNTPKTAYVLALNQNVVESAIDSRYPELIRPDGAGIGRDYLEKMLQLKIAIPPLAAPEAESYLNLLFAELHLDESDFAKVLSAAAVARRENGLAVAFNTGIAGSVLDDIPSPLADDLRWAADIAPILGSSLRGNPRQLKRFLNNLLLKHRSSIRRGANLELPVLAKLMVLEDQFNTDFEKLFDWELAAGGASAEVRQSESFARGEDSDEPFPPKSDDDAKGGMSEVGAIADAKAAFVTEVTSTDALEWAVKPHISAWLRADPPFANVDLRPYFTYSRDKLSFGVSASRLAPHLQRLLTHVQSEVDAHRRDQYAAVAGLDPSERAQLVEALLERVQRDPTSIALTAAVELAEKHPDLVPAVCASLQRVPPSSITGPVASVVVRRLPKTHPDVTALLDRWEGSDNGGLRVVVTRFRKADKARR